MVRFSRFIEAQSFDEASNKSKKWVDEHNKYLEKQWGFLIEEVWYAEVHSIEQILGFTDLKIK